MKKRDFILIITVISISIILSLLLFFNTKKGNTAVIYVNGEKYCEADILKDSEINIFDTNTAVIENGEIYMKSSTCPDKLCIRQGKISNNSKKIICLPNKVVIEVKAKSDIDAVVR